ncbi:hypothetical protein OBBRIDRAFT_890190 [Obba rivulosa]|uniref:C2H2-type domain-containing protein n=1 Tax=Obba rivulosa TaxID=1052685 RepID=A0A8E2AUC1_9APHY|nr:hypothetical protein OBBRIDRAFT_890190 [Obba rivulosa]
MKLRWLHGETSFPTLSAQTPASIVDADDAPMVDLAFVDDSAAFRSYENAPKLQPKMEELQPSRPPSRMHFVMAPPPAPLTDPTVWVPTAVHAPISWPPDIPSSMVHTFRANPLRAYAADATLLEPELPFQATGPLEMFEHHFQAKGYDAHDDQRLWVGQEDGRLPLISPYRSPEIKTRLDIRPSVSDTTALSSRHVLSPPSAPVHSPIPLPSPSPLASPSVSLSSSASLIQIRRSKRKTLDENQPPETPPAQSPKRRKRGKRQKKSALPLSLWSLNDPDNVVVYGQSGDLGICVEDGDITIEATQETNKGKMPLNGPLHIPPPTPRSPLRMEIQNCDQAQEPALQQVQDQSLPDSPLALSYHSGMSTDSISLQCWTDSPTPRSSHPPTPHSEHSSAYASCPEACFDCIQAEVAQISSELGLPASPAAQRFVSQPHLGARSAPARFPDRNSSLYAPDNSFAGSQNSVVGLGLYVHDRSATADDHTTLGLNVYPRENPASVSSSVDSFVQRQTPVHPDADGVDPAAYSPDCSFDSPIQQFPPRSQDRSLYASITTASSFAYSGHRSCYDVESQASHSRNDSLASSAEESLLFRDDGPPHTVSHPGDFSGYPDARPSSYSQMAQAADSSIYTMYPRQSVFVRSEHVMSRQPSHQEQYHQHEQREYNGLHGQVSNEHHLQHEIQQHENSQLPQGAQTQRTHYTQQSQPYAYHPQIWTDSQPYTYPPVAPPLMAVPYIGPFAAGACWQDRALPVHLPPVPRAALNYDPTPPMLQPPVPYRPPPVSPSLIHLTRRTPAPTVPSSAPLASPNVFIPAPPPAPLPLPLTEPVPESWSTLFATLKQARKHDEGESRRRQTRRVRRTDLQPTLNEEAVPASPLGQENAGTKTGAQDGSQVEDARQVPEPSQAENPAEHKCPLCARTFRLPNGLAIHLKWHWGMSRLDWKRGISKTGKTVERALASAQHAENAASTRMQPSPQVARSPDMISPPAAPPPPTHASGFAMPVIPLGTPHTGAGLFSLRSESEGLSLFGSPSGGPISPWTPRSGGSWGGNASAGGSNGAAFPAGASAGSVRSPPTWSEHLFGREDAEEPASPAVATLYHVQQQNAPGAETAAGEDAHCVAASASGHDARPTDPSFTPVPSFVVLHHVH